MKIRPLAAEFSMQKQDITVTFCNFTSVPKNGYDGECSMHYIADVRGYTLCGIPKS
jgi:hypothetical protein